MKGIIFVFSLICSYILGFTLNKGLSSTNVIKETSEEGIEFLKYDIPFMYTVRLNEIIIIILLTVLICAICSFYYKESKSSLRQILKIMERIIWSELLLFSFVIGTWSNNLLKGKGENRFIYMYNSEILPFSIVIVLLLFIYIWASYQTLEDNCKIEKKSDLYPSRKILLPIIDEYLRSIESISIIGDWGIGKSKLIENFFHTEKDKNDKKYSDKYESIIIDVSSYSENKKIISVIQEELVKILTKHKIFKININFVEKVFVENNDFLKSIKNIFFCKDSLIESKENLNEKIEELYTKSKKRIILCLDNLERLSDVDRIINLLSVTDDLLGEEIKKIYLYDKKYMIKLFENKKINFIEYMNKYSGIEIDVKEIEISEIDEIKDIKTLIDNLNKKIEEKIGYKKDEKDRVEKNEKNDVAFKVKMDNLSKNIKILEEALDSIRKTISNPRYLKYLASFIKNNEIKFEEYIKLEYRMIVDAIKDYTFESMVTKELFIDDSKYEDRIKKEDFLALLSKQYKKKESLEKQKIQELKDVGIKTNNSNELIEVIDKLIKDKQRNIIKEIFRARKEYQINSIFLLEKFLNLYICEGINIYVKKKMKVSETKLMLGEMLTIDGKSTIIGYLICETLKELKKFIRYKLNLQEFENESEAFDNGIFFFEINLKKILNKEMDSFILEIRKKFCEMDKDDEIFKFIDRKKLQKEIIILKNINITSDYESDKTGKEAKQKIKLTEQFFKKLTEKFISYNEIITIEVDKIKIRVNNLEVKEEIEKNNIDNYIDILDELSSILKTNSILERLRFDVFLLKERIVKKEKN